MSKGVNRQNLILCKITLSPNTCCKSVIPVLVVRFSGVTNSTTKEPPATKAHKSKKLA